jgi:hypothetical protein
MEMVRRPRPSLKSSSGSGAGPWTRVAIVIGIICIASVIVGLVVYSSFYSNQIEIDKETGCRVDGPSVRTVLVFDQTDTFTPIQAIDIKNQIDAYKNSAPRFGELVVYVIRSNIESVPRPIVRVCNPGNEGDVNQLVESSMRVARQWKTSFNKPIQEMMKRVLQPTSSKTSPIIETIQAVAVSEFGPKKMSKTKKELIVVSDLLQHSADISHYSGKPNEDKFVKSSVFNKLRVDLRDVDVDFLYLFRETQKSIQGDKHLRFWIRLIEEQGGSVRRIYSVSG